jgi:hypothetical protein
MTIFRLVEPFGPRRFGIHASLRSSRHILVPSFGRFDEITYLVEKASGLTHALARQRRVRRASPTATLRHPASLRPCPHIRVRAFDRFDEILYLVEKTSDLTLPDFVRWSLRCAFLLRSRTGPDSCPGVRHGVAHPWTKESP